MTTSDRFMLGLCILLQVVILTDMQWRWAQIDEDMRFLMNAVRSIDFRIPKP